ncbi:hypothetical protein TNCV_4392051 [Trichonephila clavipes]|nr:hypothetical protein TNCV_4392051 [Trichonephila clavipes]
MLAKGERAYSLVDERQRGKRKLRQGEKLNFRCRKARETRSLCVEAEPELCCFMSLNYFKLPRDLIHYCGLPSNDVREPLQIGAKTSDRSEHNSQLSLTFFPLRLRRCHPTTHK